jgi:hypothetical protein
VHQREQVGHARLSDGRRALCGLRCEAEEPSMSRTWLTDVLDRELADMLGGDRDRLADAILDALPIERIGLAISNTAFQQLRAWGVCASDERSFVAKDIAGNAALAVVGVLGDADVDDQEQASAVALEGASK